MKSREIATSIVVLLFSAPLFGGIGERPDSSVRGMLPEKSLEEVTWEGTVRCRKGTHTPDHGCDLEFVGTDGNVFTIYANKELLGAHRGRESGFQARITAARHPKYLLGGRDLTVKEFDVLGERARPSSRAE